MQSFYFYDYETWGTDPARDWPAQFAGIRTDVNFHEIDDPLNLYCRLPADRLPQPEACLVTGLTPDEVNEKGLCEAEFIQRIHGQFSRPHTCVLGYNSIRFDDEVTRYSLYRNFYDPYAREWQNGCSRWDLIDVVRLCAALRPEGIHWPSREDGSKSFRLEELTAANGIAHAQAHDAVSDVRATIALARLLREKQPRLFQYALEQRTKQQAARLLDTISTRPVPVLHVSGKYRAEQNCLAVVVPLAAHPVNKNEVVVYDLAENPEALLALDAEQLRQRIFTSRAELEEQGLSRIALKTVRLNRCPILATTALIKDPQEQARLGISLDTCRQHYRMIFSNTEQLSVLRQTLMDVFRRGEGRSGDDPDCRLYDGFFGHEDRRLMTTVQKTKPDLLSALCLPFSDARLPELLFRYRARNWPETLTEDEAQRWLCFCRERVMHGCGGASHPLDDYLGHLHSLQNQELAVGSQDLLDKLSHYVHAQLRSLAIDPS